MEQILTTKSEQKTLEELIKGDPQLKFLPDLISMAKQFIQSDKIILFGSRARGDYTKSSDVDIAFAVKRGKKENWSHFVAEVDEAGYKIRRDGDLWNRR